MIGRLDRYAFSWIEQPWAYKSADFEVFPVENFALAVAEVARSGMASSDWIASSLSGENLVTHWFDQHEGLAAWVQAIGTLIALIIAIGVPAWQTHTARQDAKRERLSRARSISILIGPELIACRDQVEYATQVLFGPGPPGLFRNAYNVVTNVAVAIPPQMAAQLDSLYLFGEPAGLTLQQLVSVISQYQDTLQRASQRVTIDTSIAIGEIQEMLSGPLKLMKKLLDKADVELRPYDMSVKVV